MSLNNKVEKNTKRPDEAVASVVPQGLLRKLRVAEIKPSATNPRHLFDRAPLNELKENIRQHGVLVPITVYELKGQKKYAILDGERRFRCCVELQDEGLDITIPANIVEPPDLIAGILYMFSIHNFRESWELMPTALSLKVVMDILEEKDTRKLSKLTGLSEPQIERCKILLSFPKKFQNLSLDPDPSTRIPSNFWIEASPVLDLCEKELPDLTKKFGRDGLTDFLVEKYRYKSIKSVIHLRRILEAYDIQPKDNYLPNHEAQSGVIKRLETYMTNVQMETRKAFDEFVVDNRRIQNSIKACDDFIVQLERAKLEHVVENKDDLTFALRNVKKYVDDLLQKLEGSDQPDLDDQSQKDVNPT
jgi:ParB/RepB/Spo0J family partition protein